MVDFKSIETDEKSGFEYRKKYFDGVLKVIENKAKLARETRNRDFSPQIIAKERELYRKNILKCSVGR